MLKLLIHLARYLAIIFSIHILDKGVVATESLHPGQRIYAPEAKFDISEGVRSTYRPENHIIPLLSFPPTKSSQSASNSTSLTYSQLYPYPKPTHQQTSSNFSPYPSKRRPLTYTQQHCSPKPTHQQTSTPISLGQSVNNIESRPVVSLERIHYEKVPSIFLYADEEISQLLEARKILRKTIDELDEKCNGEESILSLIEEKEAALSQTKTDLERWRLFTANEQCFEELPQAIKDNATPWVSPAADNIYATFGFSLDNPLSTVRVLQIKLKDEKLIQIGAVSVAQVLEEYGIISQIKWPNDVLVNHKKIAGIGSILIGSGVRLLNIGLNVNMSNFDGITQPATSILIEKGEPLDKESVLARLVLQIYQNITLFSLEGDKAFQTVFLPYLRGHAAWVGEEVIVNKNGPYHVGMVTNEKFIPKLYDEKDAFVEGVYEGLDDNGSAIIQSGNERQIFSHGRIRIKEPILLNESLKNTQGQKESTVRTQQIVQNSTGSSGDLPPEDEGNQDKRESEDSKAEKNKEICKKFEKLYGNNPRKAEVYSQNKIRVNTDLPGGLQKAKELFKELTLKEPNENLPFHQETVGNLRVQFRPTSKNGYPKIEITDIVKNTLEKITFK